MEGRGRSRRDYPSRSEEKSHHDRGNNPPSRHLWVGNLSHNLTERALAHHFLQFGELESVAFQQGRCYAFVNYRNEEDAFAAIKELQGFTLAGNPLRIEFAKAEKSLISSRDAYYEARDEPYSKARGAQFSQRDSREHRSSPELSRLPKSKMNDKDAEPSAVLWIGFPAQLKVDEFILRKAFSPFGEIEKITAFPGRTYAFVRFRKVVAACRAKETLQGKLFGNPRVHICFAKNESGMSSRERNSSNAPPSPRVRSYERTGSFENFQSDRNFGGISEDSSARSPFISNLDPGEPNVIGLARKTNLWSSEKDDLEQRYPGQGSELWLPGNIYEHANSPPQNIGSHIREFSPQNFSRQGPIYDDPWDLPEDLSLLRGTKKRKTSTFPGENELPEYPFSDLEKAKRILPHDIPLSGVLDKNYDYRHAGYRPIPERLMNTTPTQPFGERDNHWNASDDDLQVGSIPLLPTDHRRLTPDLRESSSKAKEVWKWEGMIAKGGNSVCRARCFPVGKPPDVVLPECIDCTARTTLDMLAKHYYQAASAWVVFFAPANDPDIAYYNDFMNYLGEKERAAVAKLDERTTLFLVPPSEFSEKVLKVPGKLSISGVVLRLDPPRSSHGPSQYDNREASFLSFQSDFGYQKPISPSGPYLPTPPLSNYEKPGNLPTGAVPATVVGTAYSISNLQSENEQGHDFARKPAPAFNWPSHDLQNSNAFVKTVTPSSSIPSIGSMDHPYSAMPRTMQEATNRTYTPDISGIPLSGSGVPSSTPGAGFPAEQVAQVASSLLGQQGQLGGMSNTVEYQPSGSVNQPGYSFNMPPNYGLPNDQVSSEFPPPQFGQVQQLQQQPPNLAASQREAQAVPQVNQQLQNAGQDDAEADPQKRLQATLQLAAALLQQIQQGKGN